MNITVGYIPPVLLKRATLSLPAAPISVVGLATTGLFVAHQ
ncbi:hypothetical protein P9272_28395 [Mesorhizobium sp. WSM4976]|nr:hypothetical protein [Mesorhizobium sp. WSM4976]MDG4897473.1 hypothetical protein [Mesorhizobium sp. WSM4976]